MKIFKEYNKTRDPKDLHDCSYWIFAVKGKKNEINELILDFTKGKSNKIVENVLYATNKDQVEINLISDIDIRVPGVSSKVCK